MSPLDQLRANIAAALEPGALPDSSPAAYKRALENALAESLSNAAPYNAGTWDYTQTLAPNGIFQPNWRGNWLAVDRGSVGAPLAFFTNDTIADASPIALSPGRVVQVPFVGVSICVGSGAQPGLAFNTNGGFDVALNSNPRFVCYFGDGVCPFGEDSSPDGSDSPIQTAWPAPSVQTASEYLSSLIVPPGTVITVSATFYKVVTANQSELLPYLAITGTNNIINPDTVSQFNQPASSGATAYVQATWRSFNMPRGYQQLSLICRELGADLIDTINLFGASATVG